MTDEKNDELTARYPRILGGLAWGIECGDGWYAIIDALCRQLMEPVENLERELERMLSRRKKLPGDQREWTREQRRESGEVPLEKLKTALRSARRSTPRAVQVKEKFGHLKFYVGKSGETQRALISMAEKLAATTCEVCGATRGVELRTEDRVWVKTSCEGCAGGG